MQAIYLDNNATSAVDPEVLAAMRPWLEERCGNPSSLHRLGDEAADAVGSARRTLARSVGARTPRELVFTSGGTESNQAALCSHARIAARERGARRVVLSAVEHPAVLASAERLAGDGFEVALCAVEPDGRLGVERFLALVDAAPCAVASAMWANNETGVIHDVAALGAGCRARGVAFHVDGVQALGKLVLRLAELPIDTFALSAHKLHGPKGVGALYVRRGVAFEPLLVGGPQESERRAGTENVPGIVGLGRAAELCAAALEDVPRVAGLRDRLEAGLLEAVPESRANGAAQPRIANTTNLSFAGVSGEALLALLSEEGLFASTGSACSSGKNAPSHVLLAMGLDEREASSSLRFSLSRQTTEEEISRALELVPEAVARLRALSAPPPRAGAGRAR